MSNISVPPDMNNSSADHAQQPAISTPNAVSPPPAASPAQAPAQSVLEKFKPSQTLKLSLIMFLLAGSLVVSLPYVFPKNESQPGFTVFLITGLLVIGLTAILFRYLNRINLGFGRAVLVMAFGYNAVIAVIKFILAPQALYQSNQLVGAFDDSFGVNGAFFYLLTGAIVLLLYLIVFRIIYWRYLNKLEARPEMAGHLKVPKSNSHKRRRGILLLLGILAVVLTSGGLLFLPLFAGLSAQQYLTYVFGAMAIPVVLAIVLAIFLATKAFNKVEEQAAATGNAALMASFFWLGSSLIVLYHIMWIIFMVTLVSVWPFKTVASK